MRPASLRFAWIGVLIAACEQPPDISGEIETYASVLSDAVVLICRCPQDFGFDTIIECVDAFGMIGLAERQCFTDALEGHEQDGQDYLTCANPAYENYVYCLEDDVSCTEGWYEDCTDALNEALSACPQLPADVRSTFEACTP